MVKNTKYNHNTNCSRNANFKDFLGLKMQMKIEDVYFKNIKKQFSTSACKIAFEKIKNVFFGKI